MKLINVLENYKLAILIAIGCCCLLFISNCLLVIALSTSPNKLKIYIPPQIPVSGFTTTSGQVPNVSVYSFAYYIWQRLNNWPHDGEKDYPSNIKTLSAFLTPTFKVWLMKDANRRAMSGELQDRLRSMRGVHGSGFKINAVKALGHDTWLVNLDMRLTERMNADGKRIKDVDIDYVLRVVAYNTNAKTNPWGLALDGFESLPVRTKTIV